MQIIQNPITEEEIYKLVPAYHMDFFAEFADFTSSCVCFCAVNEGQMIGYSIYTPRPLYPKSYILFYIQVDEKYQNKGIATRLLEIANKILAQSKIKLCFAMYPDDADNIMARLLEKNGYQESDYISNYEYSVQDILYSPLGQKADTMKKYLDQVKPITSMSSTEFEIIKTKAKHNNIPIEYDRVDPIFSRFYFDKGEPVAYIQFVEQSDGVIVMKRRYFDLTKEARSALPLMIVSMLRVASRVLSDDAVIVLNLWNDEYKDALIKSFDEPDSLKFIKLCWKDFQQE